MVCGKEIKLNICTHCNYLTTLYYNSRDNDMTYLLTAIGLPPGGSCTIHIYTQTTQRTTQNEQYIEQLKHFENLSGHRTIT